MSARTARMVLDSINVATTVGLRDRALLGVPVQGLFAAGRGILRQTPQRLERSARSHLVDRIGEVAPPTNSSSSSARPAGKTPT